MKRRFVSARVVCVLCIAAIFAALSGAASAQTATKEFASRDARINGASVHYTIGGSGPAVLLLHGFSDTSRMRNPILPMLRAKFIVIAPDLPGLRYSSIPRGDI